jgi:hypothetical protein
MRPGELTRRLAAPARHLAVAVGVPLVFLATVHRWPAPSLVRMEAVSEAIELTSDLEKETWWWPVVESAAVVTTDGTVRPFPAIGPSAQPRPLAFRGSVRCVLEGERDGTVSLELGPPDRCRPESRSEREAPACRPARAELDGEALDLAAQSLFLRLRGGAGTPALSFTGAVVLGRFAGDARVAPPRLLREGRVAILARDLVGSSVYEAGARVLLAGDRVRFLGADGREAVGDGLLTAREDGAIGLVFHAEAAAVRIARAELEPVEFRASVYSRLASDPFLQGLAAFFVTAWGAAVGRLLERRSRGAGSRATPDPARTAPPPTVPAAPADDSAPTSR